MEKARHPIGCEKRRCARRTRAPIVGGSIAQINGTRKKRPFQIAQQWPIATSDNIAFTANQNIHKEVWQV
ncbi:hypothetical protein [Paraburkholderia sp. J8-2]|uniref:hypothetical protein n=1 Tax=Paraburkholderia sp. J8-2 TaxID=2805440 RepID=UPI002AB5FE1C|nr:hypothetical protein [Paraburkholderia sp. J8-2]